MSVFGISQSDIIVIDHLRGRWTLPTCSNMPYSTFVPTIVCLVWPLEASRGPDEPRSVFSGCPQSDIIVTDYFWACWTLPTCSNMPYSTFVPTIVCLVWPLEASRGPDEPKSVFLECLQSDIIVIYHSWARVSPPTTSVEVSRPLWTKSDLLTLPRR